MNTFEARRVLERTQKENLEKSKSISKDRLASVAEKKMRTVFIGAISSIEDKLGFLWGQNKEPRDRTANEREYLELWKALREEILNKGNNQLRGLLLEITEYDVLWNKKNYHFDLTGKGAINEK